MQPNWTKYKDGGTLKYQKGKVLKSLEELKELAEPLKRSISGETTLTKNGRRAFRVAKPSTKPAVYTKTFVAPLAAKPIELKITEIPSLKTPQEILAFDPSAYMNALTSAQNASAMGLSDLSKLLYKDASWLNPQKDTFKSKFLWGELYRDGGIIKAQPGVGKAAAKVMAKAVKSAKKPLSVAERLGIPKGDRGNLNRFQKDALDDLQSMIDRSGYSLRYKDGKFFYGPSNTGENGLQRFVKLPSKTRFGSKDIDGTYVFLNNGKWHISNNDPSGYGGASNDAGNLIITSPARDAIDEGVTGVFPNTIDKNTMRSFWKANDQFMSPGTYISGDAGRLPLGSDLTRIWHNMHNKTKLWDNYGNTRTVRGNTGDDIINTLFRPTKWFARDSGLSVDSYMAILKQGNRPGHALRFSPDGFTVFNTQGVENKWIYDIYQKALVGDIPKTEFVKRFNDWVKPFNGEPARIINDQIIIPHPFIRYKQGGSIKSIF